MKTRKLIMATVTVLALGASPSAMAASTFYFNANQSYLSANNSPYSGGNVQLESFEDGLLNLAGVTASNGFVKGPGGSTDSVDGDDGSINGTGQQGHSFSSGSSKSITFNFTNNNSLPSMAGLVWTDGKHDSVIKFRAWDKDGNLIGKIKVNLGDLVRNGTAAEDRYLGLVSDNGISKIRIASNYAGFEIDHLQFGYGFAVVPVPPALTMGLAGLAGLGLMNRRRRDMNIH